MQRNQRRRESVFIPESSSGTGRNALTHSASTQSCRSHRWVLTPWPPPGWQHPTNLQQQQRCSAGDPWEMKRSQRAPTPVGKAKDEPLSSAAGVRPALPALSSQGRAVQAGNIHPTGKTLLFFHVHILLRSWQVLCPRSPPGTHPLAAPAATALPGDTSQALLCSGKVPHGPQLAASGAAPHQDGYLTPQPLEGSSMERRRHSYLGTCNFSWLFFPAIPQTEPACSYRADCGY